MLSQIQIQYFKCLRDVFVELDRITVLVGPNSSGKSSLLEALFLLASINSEKPSVVFSGNRSPFYLRSHGSDCGPRFAATCVHERQQTNVVLEIRDAVPQASKKWEFWTNIDPWPSKHSKGPISDVAIGRMYSGLQGIVDSAALVSFEVAQLASPSFSGFPEDELGFDGSGLASVVATLKATSDDDMTSIVNSLRLVNPFVAGLKVGKLSETKTEIDDMGGGPDLVTRTYHGFELVFELANGASLPAHLMSEGTLLTLGLLALLHSPKRPNLVLVDNLDRGLHPRAIRDVVAMLRSTLQQFPNLQLVLTTHSPYLLDWFDPSEIRLLRLNEKGETVCGRLTDHPEFEKWKDEMAPGEFWSMVGEDWLLKKEFPSEPAKA